MTDERRPLLNPVLKFNKDPRPEGITGRGKALSAMRAARLPAQRAKLSQNLVELAGNVSHQPRFADRTMLYAAMFEDSLAPTWTPGDLFHPQYGAALVAPFRHGYLVEVQTGALPRLAALVRDFGTPRDQVDIAGIEAIRFLEPADSLGGLTTQALWEAAPRRERGRAFFVSLMPFRDVNAAEDLLRVFGGFRESIVFAPTRQLLLDLAGAAEAANDPGLARAVRAISQTDPVTRALRDYRQRRRAHATLVVPSVDAFGALGASATVLGFDPAVPVRAMDPGEGREPDRPLPADLSGMPIVGVVDGGLNASSYLPAQAWSAPPLVEPRIAEVMHGNRVTSLVVQGHEWNNNLALPPLHCRVGTVAAIARRGHPGPDREDLVDYLDAVIAAHPETRVWNLSFNEDNPCAHDSVSTLGHQLAMLARKHGVLFVNSIGNNPAHHAKAPADCEAALTVGGRLHTPEGAPGDNCPASLPGPGPCGMLKPDVSNFSHVRALGGAVIAGSSFATALTSPLAAHTMDRLREPDPDLVRALLIHSADGQRHDLHRGFGTPDPAQLPWECRPGTVTLQWKATLRDRASYYWELPIPPALIKDGKLKGKGRLTAGPNYFSARLNVAVQYPKGDRYLNLLGSMDTDRMREMQARAIEHKWCPVRQHGKDFTRGREFDGTALRIYARTYTRDHYVYGMNSSDQVPLEAVFVLSLSGIDERDDIYSELREQLGSFVEPSVLDVDIDIDNG